MSEIEAEAQQSTETAGSQIEEFDVSGNVDVVAGSDDNIRDVMDYRNAIGSMVSEVSEAKEAEVDLGSQVNESAEGAELEGEAGEVEIGEVQEESAPSKPPQYRFRPEDEVEALAFDIKKRAQKSGAKVSLEEALTQAKQILKREEVVTEQVEGGEDAPDTVVSATEKLAELKAARKVAFAQDLDFERAAEIDEQIDALKDRISDLRRGEAEKVVQEDQRWNQAVSESKTKAVQFYPDVTDSKSALVKRMVEIDKTLKETGNELYYSAEKPFKLAQMAANDIGKAPRVLSSQPVSNKRPNQQQIASGNARTTQTRQNTSFGVDLSQVEDERDWRTAMSRLKAVS